VPRRPVKTSESDLGSRTFVIDLLRRLERSVHRDLEQVMAANGYPQVRMAQLAVFAHVPRGEGMRMSQLAERMQITRGAVTQLVAYLESHGLLERIPDPDDGRGVIVRPTPAAERGYELGRQRIAEIEGSWATLVGEQRWRVFASVLQELYEHEPED
jgi:DNA-binding MarR family transcriptional regulator